MLCISAYELKPQFLPSSYDCGIFKQVKSLMNISALFFEHEVTHQPGEQNLFNKNIAKDLFHLSSCSLAWTLCIALVLTGCGKWFVFDFCRNCYLLQKEKQHDFNFLMVLFRSRSRLPKNTSVQFVLKQSREVFSCYYHLQFWSDTRWCENFMLFLQIGMNI